MALTPEDVVNKRFQPTKFREGYDQDEVDDFLDEVVVELRRLGAENEELRQRLIAGESRISELQRGGGSAAAAPEAAPVVEAPEVVAEPEPAPAAVAPVPTYAAPSAVDTETQNTNNLLQLARRLHEEHVREGIEKRDALIAEGHTTAARLVGDAETEQKAKLAEAEAERKAKLADAEAEQKAQLAAFNTERSTLETKIDELRTFEREYRSKLKGYIEGQLKELDASGGLNSGSSVEATASETPAGYGFGGN